MVNVGMIGLGQMGLPMSENLLKAGFGVVGYRRGDPAPLVARGGLAARSAREVIEKCETVFVCIPDEVALRDVVSGPTGLATGRCDGRIVVELSTLKPEDKSEQAKSIAERGGVMLDCAVSGIPRMVRERSGVIYVSGDEHAYSRARPFLDAISTKVFFMGEFGNALKVKLCANMLVALNIAAAAETIAFGNKSGLDPMRLIEAVKDGAGASLQFSARALPMATGDWEVVRGSTATLAKDVQLIKRSADSVGCPIPMLESAKQIYDRAMVAGLGEKDVASVYAVAAKAAGLPIPSPKDRQ